MAVTRDQDSIGNRFGRFYRRSMVSIDSNSSISDLEDEDSAFNETSAKGRRWSSKDQYSDRLNAEIGKILMANRLLSVVEGNKNVYGQERVKHHSGGSTNGGGKKMANAWKRITEKFSNIKHQKDDKDSGPAGVMEHFVDPWRRHSLDTPSASQRGDLTRLLSLDAARQRHRRDIRQRSSSEVSRYKIVSKHGDTADFTVTAPSKLADASALCQEYFSRLTCYDALPQFVSVVAVDVRTPVSQVFNIFCENSVTCIVLWDSSQNCVVNTCHVDDLVCHLWNKAHRSPAPRLFNVENDFNRPLIEFCSDSMVSYTTVDTNLIDATGLLCRFGGSNPARGAKRLALVNENGNDILHLLSAWDILHFFSQQMSKFHAARTAFDRSLESILYQQSPSYRHIQVLSEGKSLKDVVSFLAKNGGGSLVVRYKSENGNEAVSTLSFVDIIQYVVDVHGSWNEAEGVKETLAHIIRFHRKKPSLVYNSNTPLFAVLNDWTPSMSADTVVVVMDTTNQAVIGVLQPEHLLQALLSHNTPTGNRRSLDQQASIKL